MEIYRNHTIIDRSDVIEIEFVSDVAKIVLFMAKQNNAERCFYIFTGKIKLIGLRVFGNYQQNIRAVMYLYE